MKIILTKPILERLLGGETELEVELRKCIVHEFSKCHLAAVAKEVYGDIQKLKADVVRQVAGEMGVVKLNEFAASQFRITSDLQQLIEKLVRDAIRAEIRSCVSEAWAEEKAQIIVEMKKAFTAEGIALARAVARQEILDELKKTK